MGGKDAVSIFIKAFTYAKINEVDTYVPTSQNVVYANTDFDLDLLSEDDHTYVKELFAKGTIKGPEDYLEYYNSLREKKQSSGFDNFTVNEKKFYNVMNWLSLKQKGLLMLIAYEKKVLPKIEKVHAVQKYVSLENADGDKVIGYVDLIADVKGIGTVILDNKTSAREYEEDSVLTSGQLSLYVHMLEEEYKTRYAGYIVMRKTIIKNRKKICKTCGYDGSGSRHKTCNNEVEGKRCGGDWAETISPDVFIQFITDEVPIETENIVLENFDNINEVIKAGNFTRNLNSCENYYGGKCPYFNLCYKGSMHGLVDINKQRAELKEEI
jgi:hypothetical protein